MAGHDGGGRLGGDDDLAQAWTCRSDPHALEARLLFSLGEGGQPGLVGAQVPFIIHGGVIERLGNARQLAGSLSLPHV